MEFDLTEEFRDFLVDFLENATYPVSNEDENFLLKFSDALRTAGHNRATIHLNWSN